MNAAPIPMQQRVSPGILLLSGIALIEGGASAAEPAQEDPAQSLASVVVSATRYQDPIPAAPRFGFRFNLGPPPELAFNPAGSHVFTAARRPQPPENVAVAARVLTQSALMRGRAAAIESQLEAISPAVALAGSAALAGRRPVALRGVPPGEVSRSLVLLDGVSLNDPFDGRTAWANVLSEALARIEVVPAGGASAWGEGTLGGTFQFFTPPAKGKGMWVRLPPPPGSSPFEVGPMAWGTRGTLQTRATIGDFGTRSVDVAAVYPLSQGLLQVLSGAFTTHGFPLIAAEARGPVDIAAWNRHQTLTVRWREQAGENTEFTGTVRGLEEKRGGGTPLARSETRERFVSGQLSGTLEHGCAWQVLGYAQDRASGARFSLVDPRREAEALAIDRYAQPTTTGGAMVTLAWRNPNLARSAGTTAGVELRFMRGEARENVDEPGSVGIQRFAGAEQTSGGLFLLHDRAVAENWRVSAGARIDAWNERAGHRQEWARATGAILRDERHRGRRAAELSPSAGVIWEPLRSWRIRGHVQRGFRRPTPAERYRPALDGAGWIEPNARLGTERATSGEAGAEWSLVRTADMQPGRAGARPANPKRGPVLAVQATVFGIRLQQFVGVVPQRRAGLPAVFPVASTEGTIPRYERAPIDDARVQGLDLAATWVPVARCSFEAGLIWQNATVRHATLLPALAGRRLPHAPPRRATFGLTLDGPGRVVVTSRVRWTGRQFQDLENQLPLREVVVLELGVARRLGAHLEVFLTIENLGNARIETSRDWDGTRRIGTPRLAVGGLRGSW